MLILTVTGRSDLSKKLYVETLFRHNTALSKEAVISLVSEYIEENWPPYPGQIDRFIDENCLYESKGWLDDDRFGDRVWMSSMIIPNADRKMSTAFHLQVVEI